MTKKKKKTADIVHEADRPRVHADIHPDALPLRWTQDRKPKGGFYGQGTPPPSHGPGETYVRVPHTATEAIRVNGVWISPGEIAAVPVDVAKRLAKERKVEA